MKTKPKTKQLSEEEIDERVIAEADDDSVWENAVVVRRKKSASVSLPSELAARAAFLARLHRAATLEEWVRRVIEERVELEEAAFIGLKRDLALKVAQ